MLKSILIIVLFVVTNNGMNAEENNNNSFSLTSTKERGKEADTIYVCTMHPEVKSLQPGKCPKCEMDLVPVAYQKVNDSIQAKKDSTTTFTEDYYTCSMHPEVHVDKPGNCPKCGMALVKKSEASSSGHGMMGMGMMDSSWMMYGAGIVMIAMMAFRFVK